MFRYTELGYGDCSPLDDEIDETEIEIEDFIMPNIKQRILHDINLGYDAVQIIRDLSWLWSRITDSSVERWCRAINNEVKRQAQKSRPELSKAA